MLNVLDSGKFSNVCNDLLEVWSDYIEVYTDGSLKSAGFNKIIGGTAAYFPAMNASIGIRVARLMSSTLTELWAVILTLETDALVNETMFLPFSLLAKIQEKYLVAEKTAVFDNVCHFTTTEVWHSDLHMLSGFIDRKLANLYTYLMKASLSMCFLDVGLYTVICKSFVLRNWYVKAVLVFEKKRKAALALVEFSRFVVELHHAKI
ncbi:hypothetical protein G9A89_023156 [Geosiphon pyriformis]|nr:hypothetical protein G9A89_023156 [Geosiphon pyriformis]